MTADLPTTVLCTLCDRREAVVGHACWRCRDLLNDLVDPRNTGSRYNPARPDDPIVWPSVPVLLDRLDAQRGSADPTAPSSGAFRSTSPANDHIIAIRDPRTAYEEEFALLSAQRWLRPADELCHHPDAATALRDLRALRTQLLALTGNALPRPLGACPQLVNADGQALTDPEVAAAFARTALPPGVHGPHQWPPDVWACAQPLYMPLLPPRGADESPQLPAVRCSACRHTYTGLELAQLADITHQEAA